MSGQTHLESTEQPPRDHPAQGDRPAAAQATPLRPKEHGAYAILAIPIVTALVIGGPTLVGFLIAIASITGFLAHEPLLVALGHRGRRAQSAAPAANSRLTVYLLITTVSGATAMLMAGNDVRVALMGCLLIAIVGFAFAAKGEHRTLLGQLVGVIGLSAPSVPILLAGQVSVAGSLAIWFTWLLGFSATTFAVRSVIAAQKRQPRTAHAAILLVVTLLAGIGVAMQTRQCLAIIPMLAASWYLYFRPPHAKYLKRVGWSLVGATLVSAVILALISRSA